MHLPALLLSSRSSTRIRETRDQQLTDLLCIQGVASGRLNTCFNIHLENNNLADAKTKQPARRNGQAPTSGLHLLVKRLELHL